MREAPCRRAGPVDVLLRHGHLGACHSVHTLELTPPFTRSPFLFVAESFRPERLSVGVTGGRPRDGSYSNVGHRHAAFQLS